MNGSQDEPVADEDIESPPERRDKTKKEQKRGAKTVRHKWQAMALSSKAVIWIQVVTLTAVASGVVVARLQWKAMEAARITSEKATAAAADANKIAADTLAENKRQFDLSREDAASAAETDERRFGSEMRQAESSAETSAKLTRQTISESRRAFETANRARLAVDDFSRVQLQATVPFVVTVSIVNTGNVPAENVWTNENLAWMPAPLPDLPKFKNASAPVAGHSIGAGRSYAPSLALTDPIPDKEFVEAVAAGRLRLYYFGRLEYDDGFSRERRTMWFCAQYSTGAMIGWNLCPNNNWAD